MLNHRLLSVEYIHKIKSIKQLIANILKDGFCSATKKLKKKKFVEIYLNICIVCQNILSFLSM